MSTIADVERDMHDFDEQDCLSDCIKKVPTMPNERYKTSLELMEMAMMELHPECGVVVSKNATPTKEKLAGGNGARMREELEAIFILADEDNFNKQVVREIRKRAAIALSAPPRNCDLPTVIANPHIAWLEDCDNWDEFGNPKKEIHEWLLAKAKGGAE